MTEKLKPAANTVASSQLRQSVIDHRTDFVVEPDGVVLERLIRATEAHEAAVDITALSKNALLARWRNK